MTTIAYRNGVMAADSLREEGMLQVVRTRGNCADVQITDEEEFAAILAGEDCEPVTFDSLEKGR